MGLQLLTPPFDTSSAGLRHPFGGTGRIRAVLFDLDGTLYDQRQIRRTMARELLLLPLTDPFGARRRLRGLQEYRRAQESLRHGPPLGAGGRDQLELAAARAGIDPARLERDVEEWMQRRPLRHLRRARAKGLVALLDFLRAYAVKMGVFSDYPGRDKLKALGVAPYFSHVWCATDPAIAQFKPQPRGFLHACETWNLPPEEVLMVGDRIDADGLGAIAAGLPCVIIGSTDGPLNPAPLVGVPSFERLLRVFDPGL